MINIGKESRLDYNILKRAYMQLNTTSPSPLLIFNAERCIMTDDKNKRED